MQMNPLNVCDYLLVALILLPGSNPRSLNADQTRPKNGTAEPEEGSKSFSSLKEIDNFVDGQCPPRASSLKINGIGGACKYECSTDIDCSEDYKCCESGCSFVCMEPWFPKRVVDWAKSSSPNQISDDPELADQTNELWKSRGEPCSTSVLDGLQPLRCPTNYVCQITMDEDIQLNIPNRGECVKINDKKSATGINENANYPDFSILDTVCAHQGKTYKHKEQFRKDCNICVCHNGVVFCDNRHCPVKIGIPAAVLNYEEHRQTSRYKYISVDNEDDKNDTSDSSGSVEGDFIDDEEHEESRDEGNVRLTNFEEKEISSEDEGDQSQVESGDDEIDPEQGEDEISGDDDISGDDEQGLRDEHWREVNSRDTEQENSGDEPQNQGNLDNQELGGESGSAEVETEGPEQTKPTTTPYDSEILISAPRRSTLAPQTSTLVAKKSTLAPKTSNAAPKRYSSAPKTSISTFGIETTESSRSQQIEPTEDIIRLEKSDYEPSGFFLEKYSGDDEEEGSSEELGSSEGIVSSADESSTEETESSESVYPGTIVLGKYVAAPVKEAGFGFETDHPRTDLVNDGSLKTSENKETEERSGVEGSATGSIEATKDTRKYKRKGKTLEYFATTDDEHLR